MAKLAPIVIPWPFTTELIEEGDGEPPETYIQAHFAASIPTLPPEAMGAVIFSSVWAHSQNAGVGPIGVETTPTFEVFFDGIPAEEPITIVTPRFFRSTTGPYMPGVAFAAPPPSYFQGAYAIYDHPFEANYYKYEPDPIAHPGFFAVPPEVSPPRFCDNLYRFPVPSPLPGTGSAEERVDLVVPFFTFHDPLWQATYRVPALDFPETRRIPRPDILIPREAMPSLATADFRGKVEIYTHLGETPWESDTEWSFPDARLIIIPFTQDEGFPPTVGPGRDGKVHRPFLHDGVLG